MIRECLKCESKKDLAEFPIYKSSRDGTQYHRRTCFECHNAVSRNWQYKSRYGLTFEEYSSYMERGCEICGATENLNLDHDHNCCSGQRTCGNCIRGVLCYRHNRGEGFFDNIDEFNRMEIYLLKNTNVLGDILS